MAIEKFTDAEIIDLGSFVDDKTVLTSGPGELPKKTTTKKVKRQEEMKIILNNKL